MKHNRHPQDSTLFFSELIVPLKFRLIAYFILGIAVIFGVRIITREESIVPSQAIPKTLPVDNLLPLDELIMTKDLSVCLQTVVAKVDSLPPFEKMKLADKIAEKLKQNPDLLTYSQDPATLTPSQIAEFNGASTFWNDCLLRTISLLGGSAKNIFPSLLAYEFGKHKPVADGQLYVTIERLLKFPEMEALPRFLEIYDRNEIDVSKAGSFLSKLISESKTFSPEVSAFLLNKEKALIKRTDLLARIAEANAIQKIDLKTIIALQADSSPEIQQAIKNAYNHFKIETQENLDLFLSLNLTRFEKFDLNKREDWTKLNEISVFLRELSDRTRISGRGLRNSSKLNYAIILKPLNHVLQTVAQQMGYQTDSFKSLANAIARSPMGASFIPYFETLLNGKAERPVAIDFFYILGQFPQTGISKIIKQLQTLPDKEKILLLNQMPTPNAFKRYSTTGADFHELIEQYVQLLGNRDVQITSQSLRLIKESEESILPYLKSKLNEKNLTAQMRLQLLRLQWHFTSTENGFSQLEKALEAYSPCDSIFAEGFVDLLSRQADTIKPDRNRNSIAEFKAGGRRTEETVRVNTAPKPKIFTKYLMCDQKYLQAEVISDILQIDPKLKPIVTAQAQRSESKKRAFLIKASAVTNSKKRKTDKDNSNRRDYTW